ncbi:MAG: RHS repeat domain-containing protein, partial [Actinomycetota bacterium]
MEWRNESGPIGPFPLESVKVVTYDYAVDGDPLTTSASEAGLGPLTTKVDLGGRPVSYTDVWGWTTTRSYDQAGRPTAAHGPRGATAVVYGAATGAV